MEILILFAFLAGVVTIISPCVLPVLPALLSTASGGGKLRPVGIAAGFAAAFTVVTLAVTAAAQALALPTSWLRLIAIIALGIFDLTLLVPTFGRAVERILSPLTRTVDSQPQRTGFMGGTVIGAGLGLLWSPCVGPIMAAALSLTALAGITPGAFAITLAYSLGAALPMLLLAYGGRRVMLRSRDLRRRTPIIRQVFGALTVLACVGLLVGADARLQSIVLDSLPAGFSNALIGVEQSGDVQAQLTEMQAQTASQLPTKEIGAITSPTQTMSEPTSMPTSAPTSTPQPQPTARPSLGLDDLGPAPELTGITQWFNSEPTTLEQLRGKVVIVNFWTFDCINCRHTMPYVKDLYAKYHDKGLEIVGVHTPELSFEYVPENVKAAIKDQGIAWPVAFDPNYKTWSAFNNIYWPAFYFLDVNGHIRYTHFGEGNYDRNEQVVQKLLTEVAK